MDDIVQCVAAKALILYDGKILLLKEADTEEATQVGLYGLAGGRVDLGESFKDGLKREVKEETGLEIARIHQPLFVGEWSPVIKGVTRQIIAIFMLVGVDSNKVTLSEEHDSFVWIDPSKYKEYNMMPPDDLVIEEYLKQQKS